MYRRGDPRFRRTLNEISQTFESANESAQDNLFIFSQKVVNPCLNGVFSCLEPCIDRCFPPRDQRSRRNRTSRGRAELNFDFYDDWEDDENDGLLGWGDDEHDGLLSGGPSGVTDAQPGRHRAMSYGTRRDAKGRRKSGILDADTEATGVPASSYFGLFGKLTGKIGGGKVLRYKPSAANLQEHPGEGRKFKAPEGEPLLEESEGEGRRKPKHGRSRSGTAGSGTTSDSLSSRGDLIPSEDEDDAMELDDEFAMVLERRTTNSGLEDESSSKGKSKKRPKAGSRKSTGTLSSKSSRNSKRFSRAESSKSPTRETVESPIRIIPSLTELKQEEEQARLNEEADVARRREAAEKLASERGLGSQKPQQVCHSCLHSCNLLTSLQVFTSEAKPVAQDDEIEPPLREMSSPLTRRSGHESSVREGPVSRMSSRSSLAPASPSPKQQVADGDR